MANRNACYNTIVPKKSGKQTLLTLENFVRALKNQKEEIISEIRTEVRPEFSTIKHDLAHLSNKVENIEEELRKRPTRDEMEHLLHGELNKVAMIILPQLEQQETKLDDHETRINKLETATP